MKNVILVGAAIGMVYGGLILAPVLGDAPTGLALGLMMGIGSAAGIALALEPRKKYRR